MNDEILEELFNDVQMQTLPIGAQCTAINVFERFLMRKVKENEYGTISELLSTTDTELSATEF